MCDEASCIAANPVTQVNLLGRSSPRMLLMDILLLRQLGLDTVLHALSTYGQDRAGQRGCPLENFGDPQTEQVAFVNQQIVLLVHWGLGFVHLLNMPIARANRGSARYGS